MQIDRRQFLKVAGAASLCSSRCLAAREPNSSVLVNDVHSQLNATHVASVTQPGSLESLQKVVRRAAQAGKAVCVAGGRHAMGAQQFATDAVLIDSRKLNRILRIDPERHTAEVEAGIQWPELIAGLLSAQQGQTEQWSIAQKQTGADRLTLGGALAANIHGRGLQMKPLAGDVESFRLVDANGQLHTCSRSDNSELFRLAIGGYGLFGIVHSITLRLVRRQKVRRSVEFQTIDKLIPAFEQRIGEGFAYGDFQFAIDERSDDFLRRGVFSCYRPVGADTPLTSNPKQLATDDWLNLLTLAHTDRTRAFEEYSRFYLSTSGQVYWSDTHQLGHYFDDYHREVDKRLNLPERGTEMITEIYVPRERLVDFMGEARRDFRQNRVEVIYGTIRLIERDDESFLAWARQRYACVVFNLHTAHSPDGLRRSAEAFRRLIDMAIYRKGSFYLTYHKFATREQVAACYPQFEEFLKAKLRFDPKERFQSDWYRHYKQAFALG